VITLQNNLIALILGVIVLIESAVCAIFLRRLRRLQKRLEVAVAAAEDAARAAALASPGGIDPEVVISLLRSGQPVTLDAVYAHMEKQSRTPVNQS
jgi:hypothetical protein